MSDFTQLIIRCYVVIRENDVLKVIRSFRCSSNLIFDVRVGAGVLIKQQVGKDDADYVAKFVVKHVCTKE